MKVLKPCSRLMILLLCMALLTAGMTVSAKETILECEYVPITENGFVADTFNGVEARYNLYGKKIQCTELVRRYFKEVFGLDVSCPGWGGPVVLNNEEYWFEVNENPQIGDVMFSPSYLRGRSYNHWAICKSVDLEEGTITMFEQNWRWNNCAGVGRQIPYETDCYIAYQLCNAEGRVLSPIEEYMKLEEEVARKAAAAMEEMVTMKAQLAAQQMEVHQAKKAVQAAAESAAQQTD